MSMQWINRTIPTLIGMFILLIAIIVVAFAMALYPYVPLRVDNVIITPEKARIGEKICFQFEGEKFYSITSDVTVELVNGESYHVMSYPSNMDKGTAFKPRCFIVPLVCPDKEYQLRWTATYEMNPLNHPKVVVNSRPFEVRR